MHSVLLTTVSTLESAPLAFTTVDTGRLASKNNSNRMPAGHAETSKHSTKQSWICELLQSNWPVVYRVPQVPKDDPSIGKTTENSTCQQNISTANCNVYFVCGPRRLMHLHVASTTTVKHSMLQRQKERLYDTTGFRSQDLQSHNLTRCQLRHCIIRSLRLNPDVNLVNGSTCSEANFTIYNTIH